MEPARDPVLLFPGQGTEAPGMSGGWEAHPAWGAAVDEVARRTGLPLRERLALGPAEALRAQDTAPFAVLAHSVGVFRAWRAAGLRARAAAGHSMGFYSALVAAEVVPLAAAVDLIRAVEARCAEVFAHEPMGMAFVIGIAEGDLRAALARRPGLDLSNRNGRAQFTVSGPRGDLEALVAELGPEVLKAGLLPVRHPLHGPRMAAVAADAARALAGVAPADPAFPLVAHDDGRLLATGAEAWAAGLASVAEPVDWLAVTARLQALGGPCAECGHGSQLAGLTRWADRTLEVRSLQSPPPG